MAAVAPIPFDLASAAHVRRLARLIDRGGVARVRRVYEQAVSDLERKITRDLGRGSAPFTVQQHRALLAQARSGLIQIARSLGDAVSAISGETQVEALRALIATIKRHERRRAGGITTLPIEEASRFHGLVDQRKTSLLAMHRTSMAKYGAQTIRKIEHHLASALLTGETTSEAVDRVAKTADTEFWRAERVVRTELAHVHNATQRDGIAEADRELGDLFMRWTEMVDDDSGQPLDDRVAADSVALHGQVVRPGELFTMPDSARRVVVNNRYGKSRVAPEMIGQSWEHPPNRPNDRSTIAPWRPGWEVPGWRVVGGRKEVVRAA